MAKMECTDTIVPPGGVARMFDGPNGQPAVHCEIDHVVEHSDGGPTSLDNGQPLCRARNLTKERIRKLNARRRPQRGP